MSSFGFPLLFFIVALVTSIIVKKTRLAEGVVWAFVSGAVISFALRDGITASYWRDLLGYVAGIAFWDIGGRWKREEKSGS